MIDGISSAIYEAASGMRANELRVDKAANDLAQLSEVPAPGTPISNVAQSASAAGPDPVEDAVNLIVGKYGFEANAKVIQVSDEMLKKTYQMIS